MSYRTKFYFQERVITGLINQDPDIDWKIDKRDILTQLDAVVNAEAKAGFLANWKAGAPGVSETFITTWDEIDVVDQENSLPSYFTMPVNYADLPMEQGIVNIWPLKWQTEGKNYNVVITTQRDYRRYLNNMAGNYAMRLAGYPLSTEFHFTTCDVKKKYGNMGLRLVVRDSSIISDTAPYPIPADKEELIIKRCIDFFREKRMIVSNRVRDKIDQA